MLQEIKKFRFTCDKCKAVKTITTTSEPSSPKGWKEKLNPDWHSFGALRTMDLLCPKCLVGP